MILGAYLFAVRDGASISDLQRPLGLTYNRAADVVAALERIGWIGRAPGHRPGRRTYLGVRGVVARFVARILL